MVDAWRCCLRRELGDDLVPAYAAAVVGTPTVAEAERLARDLLEGSGDRWSHVKAVARRAEELTPACDDAAEKDLLVAAAWLHDVGYSDAARDSGAHQVDGACYLASAGASDRLCALVAHHSAASYEVGLRGLAGRLGCWPREESAVADALWMADMTTGPRGEPLDYPDRLAEILTRYEDGSVVARAMRAAEPDIRAAIDRTRERMVRAYTT